MNSSFEDKESDLSGDEELDLSEDEGIYPHKDEQFDPSKYEEFYPLHHRYRGFSMTIMCLNNQFPYRKLFENVQSLLTTLICGSPKIVVEDEILDLERFAAEVEVRLEKDEKDIIFYLGEMGDIFNHVLMIFQCDKDAIKQVLLEVHNQSSEQILVFEQPPSRVIARSLLITYELLVDPDASFDKVILLTDFLRLLETAAKTLQLMIPNNQTAAKNLQLLIPDNQDEAFFLFFCAMTTLLRLCFEAVDLDRPETDQALKDGVINLRSTLTEQLVVLVPSGWSRTHECDGSSKMDRLQCVITTLEIPETDRQAVKVLNDLLGKYIGLSS